MTPGKTVAFTRWTFVGKVMSLLFKMHFRIRRLFYVARCFPSQQTWVADAPVWLVGKG